MASTKTADEKILTLPLSDVLADFDWNSRSGIGATEGGADEENTFQGIMTSIRERGQDTPVEVRTNTVKGSKKPYFLMGGFRRYRAISQIAKDSDNKNPTIRVVVREMSDAEAVEYNLRENTCREPLSGPDLTFGIERIMKMGKHADGSKITGTSIANALGLSQPYVSRIMRVIEGVTPGIRKDWRERVGIKPTVEEMAELAKIEDKASQKLSYDAIVQGKAAAPAGGSNVWIENTRKAAHAAGKLYGTLVRKGLIIVPDVNRLCFEGLAEIVNVKSKADDNQRLMFSSAAVDGYEEGLKVDDNTTTAAPSPAPKNGTAGAAVPS